MGGDGRTRIDGYGQGYTVTFTLQRLGCGKVIRLILFQEGCIGQFGRSSRTLIDLDRTGNSFAGDIGLQVRYLLSTTPHRICWSGRGGRLTSDTNH